jgi:hypothetical protein
MMRSVRSQSPRLEHNDLETPRIIPSDFENRHADNARFLSEDDDHIFSLTPHNVTGVRLAIGTDQQDKLIRNVDARRDFDGGTERRHISDCATDLRIRKDDLTGFKTPNRGSAFMHGVDPSSAVVRQNYFSNRCRDTLIAY